MVYRSVKIKAHYVYCSLKFILIPISYNIPCISHPAEPITDSLQPISYYLFSFLTIARLVSMVAEYHNTTF